MENEKASDYSMNEYKNKYYNESLADLVKNVHEKDRIIEYEGKLYQQINPIFVDPRPSGPLTTVRIFLPLRRICSGKM